MRIYFHRYDAQRQEFADAELIFQAAAANKERKAGTYIQRDIPEI